MTTRLSDCARCPFKINERLCRNPQGKAPENCPTLNFKNLTRESLEVYKQEKYAEFACQASIQETEAYADRELGYARIRPV
ncbi:MAG: metal-binding protein, partial [Deltaproteobacteria bacterium]|nr:metal-binding protein [Deltaproteobacteria bacterium]